jgi:hypothetical protein
MRVTRFPNNDGLASKSKPENMQRGDGAMKLFIKEWPNKTATIMTENGQVVWTFSSREIARHACQEWFATLAEKVEYCEILDEDRLAYPCPA